MLPSGHALCIFYEAGDADPAAADVAADEAAFLHLSPDPYAAVTHAIARGGWTMVRGLMVTSATTTLPGSMSDSMGDTSVDEKRDDEEQPHPRTRLQPQGQQPQPSAGGGAGEGAAPPPQAAPRHQKPTQTAPEHITPACASRLQKHMGSFRPNALHGT